MSQAHRYGVIPWNKENVYRKSECVKTFRHEGLADKTAHKLNTELAARGEQAVYVVRLLHYMREA